MVQMVQVFRLAGTKDAGFAAVSQPAIKKSLFGFLFFLLLLTTSNAVFAQTSVQIGMGTDVPANTLYGPVYRYSSTSTSSGARVNMLWTASEMATAGIPAGAVITGIEFNKVNAGTFNGTVPFQMLVANTANTALATTATWAGVLSTHTSVINNPAYNVPATAGWVTYTFSSPFTYTGGAFEVATEHSISGLVSPHSTDAIKWEYTTGFADKIVGAATATATTLNGTVTAYKHRPNIRILYTGGAACSGTPTAGTASSTVSTVCSGGSLTLSLAGATAASGIGVQWQSSADGTSFTDIAGATSYSYATTQAATTYYRAMVTCNGINPVYSNVVTVATPSLVSGAFTINKNAATGGTNFQSFAAAISYISCGINGPVTFDVVAGSGTYTEQVIIPAISGVSAANTITINGNGNTVAFASANTSERAVIKLNGADYVTINNLVIDATAGTYGWGIQLMNGADNNTISNSTINSSLTSTSSNFAGIVASGSASSATTAGVTASNTTISNNTINGGYYGIVMVGNGATGQASGNTIAGNTVKNAYYYGVYIDDQDRMTVSGNDIHRLDRTAPSTFYGIYLTGFSQRVTVEKNRLHDVFAQNTASTSAAYIIYSSSNDAPAGLENIVKNNVIFNIKSAGSIYAIYNSGSDGVYYYHNTISLDDLAATGGLARGFYQLTAASNIQFINNNISITRGGTGSKHALYFGTTTSAIASNRNNLYVNSAAGTNGVGYFGANFVTLADWQTANGGVYDLNSASADPAYVNLAANNLQPTSGAINNIGQALATVTDDITGAARSATPDPGAYEFTPAPLDMGATALATPVAVSCFSATQSVAITIQNFGGVPIDFSVNPTTVTVNVTGAATQTLSVVVNTGTLAAGATLDVTVGTLDMSVVGTYTFNASATVTGDANAANDAMTPETRTLAPVAALPQQVDFTGFTGTNLTTVFPNWSEATGVSPAGLTSTWVASNATQTTALGTTTAKINLFTSTKNEWMIGPKVMPTATTALRFKAAVTDYANGNATTEMAGTDDKVQVMVSTDCGATFTAIETLDGTDNLTNVLTSQTVSLAAYAGQNIIVAFYGTDGPVDEGVDYDFHIDDIFIGTPPTLDLGATALVTPVAGACYSATEVVTVTIQNFAVDPIDFSVNPTTVTVNVTGAATQTLTATVNTGTLASGATLDVNVGTLNMTAAGTYTFNISATVSGDGNTSNDALAAVNRANTMISAFPHTENFDSFTAATNATGFMNGWTATPANTTAAFRWNVDEGTTPSSGTGPTNDHTTGSTTGKFIFTEASSGVAGAVAEFISPCIDLTAQTSAIGLEFWYHMFGATMGNLHVDVYNGTAWVNSAFTLTGQQQTATTDPWLKATVNLAAYNGNVIKVRFRAERGADFYGDMAIDDIRLFAIPSLDLGATVLVGPAATGCYSSTEPVVVTIKNFGTSAINFLATPATVTVNVTGAVTQTLSVSITENTLAAGSTMNVTVGDLNMTTVGVYTFNGNTTIAGDGDATNNAMLQTTRTVTAWATLPDSVNFTGFTGSNLSAVFPNWKEATGIVPAGATSSWTAEDFANVVGGPGGTAARINLFSASKKEWIIGPKFIPVASSQFTYTLALTTYNTTNAGQLGSDDVFQVMISTNCGATYQPVQTFNSASVISPLGQQEVIDLTAYAGQNVIIAFYATEGTVDDANDNELFIDNVRMGQATPLPVTMVYFKAEAKGKNTILDWQTALEENNAGFEVEVSTDMEQFRKLGFVTGKGSNSTYQFTDAEAGKQGTRYYRLKQVDVDGTASYSQIRAVNFSKAMLVAEAWPNPFRNKLNVQLSAKLADKVELQLTDAMGRVVATEQVTVKAEGQALELNLPENLATGIYLLQVQHNQQKTTLKVIKN